MTSDAALERPACPVCASPGAWFRSFGAEHLYRCGGCASLFYHPPPHREPAREERPCDSPKWYVERGANLFFYAEIAAMVEALCAARRLGAGARVLEVGCSYGFLLDLGRALHGWRVAGADPAPVAREGARDLSLPIRLEALEDASFAEPFDVVVGVQLVEHLADPPVFLARCRRALASGGILVLTTPDAEFEDLGADYDPGEHHVLFSRGSLGRVLRAAGFPQARFLPTGLPQMLAVAASPEPLPSEGSGAAAPLPGGAAAAVEEYLRLRLGTGRLPRSLGIGLAFRLYELLVNAGRYAEALELESALERLFGRGRLQGFESFVSGLTGNMLGAPGRSGYVAAGPGCLAPYLLYRGILALNHRRDRKLARSCLDRAVRLFTHEVRELGLAQYAPFLPAARAALEAAGGAGR